MIKGKSGDITVIGSINTDMLVKCRHLPQPGETVLGQEFLMSGGGKGANQAIAAARLGAAVKMVGCVGADSFGAQAITNLQAESIDCQQILSIKESSSGIALINVDDEGENQIVVAPGANNYVSNDQVSMALESANENSIILLQLEIPLPVVRHAISVASAKHARVILDPAPAQVLDAEMLDGIFLLTPNQTEAEQLTGLSVTDTVTEQQAVAYFLQQGVQNVALTLGARGVMLGNENGIRLVPGIDVQAIDTTAAGDCFNGALANALLKNHGLPEATAYACKAAAISVTRLGAQQALPTEEDMIQ